MTIGDERALLNEAECSGEIGDSVLYLRCTRVGASVHPLSRFHARRAVVRLPRGQALFYSLQLALSGRLLFCPHPAPPVQG